MNMWLVMNIGCLECGVSSAIVGVFADKEKAEAIADECDKKYSWREGGQNHFEVFEIPGPETVADEYKGIGSGGQQESSS
jgi:hypothetical protein